MIDRILGLVFIAAIFAIGIKLQISESIKTNQYGVISFGKHHSEFGIVIIIFGLYISYVYIKNVRNNGKGDK